LLFDSTVGGRLGRELVERCAEETLGLLASTEAAVDEAEVGDHASLVLLVPELPKDDERLLEVLKRSGVAGMGESEGEVVESQCLVMPVTEGTNDGKRGTMLLGCQLVLAFTSKLRSELVEPERLLLPVYRPWFATAVSQEEACPMGSDPGHLPTTRRETLQPFLKGEIVDPGPCVRERPLDRTEGNPQSLLRPVAAQEPEPSRHYTSEQQ
jgi:hypothetical protein